VRGQKKASGSVSTEDYQQRELVGLAEEKHYSPGDLSDLWGFAPSTIRELFAEEQGVIRIGAPSRRAGRTLKRSYWTLRIPASVAQRVHSRLTSKNSRRA
jgi:hypothetical protein